MVEEKKPSGNADWTTAIWMLGVSREGFFPGCATSEGKTQKNDFLNIVFWSIHIFTESHRLSFVRIIHSP